MSEPPLPRALSGSVPRSTVVTIALAVALCLGAGPLLDAADRLPSTATAGLGLVMGLLPYLTVAIGAGLLAQTRRGQELGVALPLLGWGLRLVPLPAIGSNETTADVTILLTFFFDTLVVAGWGFARRAGRLWLLGLPLTYVLLVALSELQHFSFTDHNQVKSWDIPVPLAGSLYVAVLVIGGIVCWLLEAEEHRRRHHG